MSLLQDQFDEYQTTYISELPTYTSESDIHYWAVLGRKTKLFDIFVRKKRFNVLCKVAKTLLVLPNSNADSERVFFLAKNIHTEFRYDLNNDTLCALLTSKMNQDSACYEFVPSSSLLKDAKSATNDYNKSLTC